MIDFLTINTDISVILNEVNLPASKQEKSRDPSLTLRMTCN